MFSLSNDILEISIAAKGAELQSIYNKQTSLQHLWSGDPVFWGKKSPVLFPIVGGLKNNRYRYEGNEYELGRHGFARDREFSVHSTSGTHIHFMLKDDGESFRVYPFRFNFSVIYTLIENSIEVTYRVENTDEKLIYFSVGGHPALAVPFMKDISFEDHYLRFGSEEHAGKWPLSKDGLIETAPVDFLVNTRTLPLTKPLFYKDALVFKHLLSDKIALLNTKNKHGLELSFKDFPYMGIWSAKDADFVCIEPWCGIADSVNATGDITQKEGIHSLQPGEIFERSWNVKFF